MKKIYFATALASAMLFATAATATTGEYDNMCATAGVHPHDSSAGVEGLAELLDHPKVVAVGECGLRLCRAKPKGKCAVLNANFDAIGKGAALQLTLNWHAVAITSSTDSFLPIDV